MKAKDIADKYIKFFEERGHKRIKNSSLVPENDPTTLFTSSGMQPLVPYLLGEEHPEGKRLVNVQNSFRTQDIEEVGDNRHTTFFRMLGNWSLGDYFKKEQLLWFFEFLTEELGLDVKRLYVSVFEGTEEVERDEESAQIWKEIFENEDMDSSGRIFYMGPRHNWWSRAGLPETMPDGEPGGPDSEVYFDLKPGEGPVEDLEKLSDSGRLLEIGNSVFMEYQKTLSGFKKLPQQNVDFGGGLERILAAYEDSEDIFLTSLFHPIIKTIEKKTGKNYEENQKEMRIATDHFVASIFIAAAGVLPSNKEQGYILRRLIRRGLDSLEKLGNSDVEPVIEEIVLQYKDTDSFLQEKFEEIKGVILEEQQTYSRALSSGKKIIEKELGKMGAREGGELKGVLKIPAELAFRAASSYGLGPTQLESLGYTFDKKKFSEIMKQHQKISRAGAEKKFQGGLADHSELTIKGHTATHLLHQALRDVLGDSVHQSGSNITSERVRFDFNFERKLAEDEIKSVENIVNQKIKENLPVKFEIMPTQKAKELGAIGLFEETYQENSKIYFIGNYSKEFCGGPHVDFTGKLKSFKIIKQENLGKGQKRIYARVT